MCKRQERTTWHLRTVRCLVFFPFFDIMRCLFKRKREREDLARDSSVKLQPYCCRGFGRAKPAISVATPPPPPALSAVGLLRLLQGSKQASNLYFKIPQVFERLYRNGLEFKRYVIKPQTLTPVKYPDTPRNFPLLLPLSFYSSSYYLSF